MLYPTISNWYNELTGSYAIQEFRETLADRTEQELTEQRAMAEAYNATLRNEGTVSECPYAYNEIMDFGNGMMKSIWKVIVIFTMVFLKMCFPKVWGICPERHSPSAVKAITVF